MNDFSIRDVISKIQDGIIRIPAFQRGFVWDADDVAFLMDSIYKGYPFGAIQLWRTKELLKTEKNLGPFSLFSKDDHYPIDYVLDGQQRLTSIFGVFQTELAVSEELINPFKIYFDFTADEDLQDSQFFALTDEEVDTSRHFPLNVLFDTVEYRKATNTLTADQILKIDDLQSRFKEVKIPYQTLESDDKTKVSIVFERINRKGVPLDAYQLLTAWTWSEDFDLKQKFEELADELKYYGFEEVGSNINLLMRIGSAILTADGSLTGLINLNGASVRNRFDEITNGVKGAIDFLKTNLGVQKLENLPYETLLIPLAVFFSNQGNKHFNYNTVQRSTLERWFWRACFSKRYSAGTLRAINKDIEEMNKLKSHLPNNLASINVNITDDFFKKNGFTMGTVHTKTFILMLAQNKPRSFVSGAFITLNDVLKDYNKNEFHHIYPRAFLKATGSIHNDSCLANFCFMSRADNKKLGGDAPSVYKQHMAEDSASVLASSYIDGDILFLDDFESFLDARASALTSAAALLIG